MRTHLDLFFGINLAPNPVACNSFYPIGRDMLDTEPKLSQWQHVENGKEVQTMPEKKKMNRTHLDLFSGI